MKQATKQKLQALLDRHDRAYLKKLEIEHDWVRAGEAFDQKFEKIRDGVIRPTMTEVHDLMAEHGLKSQITVTDREVHSDGKVKPASIARRAFGQCQPAHRAAARHKGPRSWPDYPRFNGQC